MLQEITRKVTLGPFAGMVAVVLLAVDPLFTYRAREIRYDWLALIGVIWAFVILQNKNRSGEMKSNLRFLLAGLLVGVGVNSHVLYLLYSFVFGLIIIIPFDSGTKIRDRFVNLVFFSVGFIVSLTPYAFYIFSHQEAFLDQLVYQAGNHKQHNFNVGHILSGEMQKYVTYYKHTPFLLLLYFYSLIIGVLLLRRLHSGRSMSISPVQYRYFKQLLFIGLLMPVILACTSGGHSWHHLMISPFWAMLVASVLSFYPAMKNKLFWSHVLSVIFLLGILNGLLVSWGLRTYSAIESWGTRDASVMAAEIKKHIPQGVRVYGDYHLIFIAWEQDWQFVQEQYLVQRDENLLSQIPYDYLIYSDGTKGLAKLNMNNYEKVTEIEAPDTLYHLPKLNPTNVPLKLKVYKSKHKAVN